LGLFVAEPRQILSEDEKESRLNQAVNSFINETVYLKYPTEEIVNRLTQKLNELDDSKKK